MNQAIIQKIIDGSFSDTLTFPEVVKNLLKEGIESYHVDFLRNENRYYNTDGESLVVQVEHSQSEIGKEFSADKIKAVIQKIQAGKIAYAEFCMEAKAAGCSYYIAYLNGKMVRYLGRNGEEHVEYFPKK